MIKISIIEDDELLRKWICNRLIREWFEVTSENADLYILDLWVDGKARWEVLEALRKHTDSPIMILSWFGTKEYKERGLAMWADKYVFKPIMPTRLISEIKELLWKKQ